MTPSNPESEESEEASVQAKRTERGAKRDTPPLLLTDRNHLSYDFYSVPLNLPSYTASHLWLMIPHGIT